jgi:ATPase subunit of ABC transporter with duplicated ATPase domains
MIAVIELSMRFGARILFQGVTLQFNPGNRYGLLGANGSGKSTFIQILTGDITPDGGEVRVPSQMRVGTLKQDHYSHEEENVLDVVMQGRPALWDALVKRDILLQQNLSIDDCHQLAKLEEDIVKQDGYLAASEAAKLLEGLGIQQIAHSRPLKLLSGGYKLRVLLAQVLFSRPEILVLDEPTNHLDLYSIRWLEGYLASFPGTLILSSHDRDFLNRVCTHMADIDYGTIKVYKGNYDAFSAMKEQGQEQKGAQLAKQDKRRNDMQQFVDRFGAKATKARQAQSKAKMIEKLEEEMDAIDLRPSSRLYPKLQFLPERPSGAIPLVVKCISKSFGQKVVLHNVSFEVDRGDKIALIGPNGIGKSTLLEILTNSLTPDEGAFTWGHGVHQAYFPQDHRREVHGAVSLLEWLGAAYPEMTQEQLRGALGRVLFEGDRVNQAVGSLSGGETARLILAKMILAKPNVLIFDEPTNHLDIEAIDELTLTLETYEGTLLVVSHNRYFVSKIAKRVIEIAPDGIKDYRCTYEEYLRLQGTDHLASPASLKQRYEQQTNQQAAQQSMSSDASSYEEQKKLRNLKAQLKKKASQAEEECLRLELEIKKIDTQLAEEGFYEKTPRDKIQAIINMKESLEKKLAEAFDAWEASLRGSE